VGYGLGYLLFDATGDYLVAMLTTPEQFESIRQQIHRHGFWYVLSVGITPIPFQIAMLAAGATGYSFVLYLLATTISRFLRYFGLALLVYLFGNQAERLFRAHKTVGAIVIFTVIGLIWFMILF